MTRKVSFLSRSYKPLSTKFYTGAQSTSLVMLTSLQIVDKASMSTFENFDQHYEAAMTATKYNLCRVNQ